MTEQAEKPSTIPQAVEKLRALLPASQLEVVKSSTAHDLVRFHFNLGSYIRNLWVHREGSPLTSRIKAAGGRVGEGDELSRLIIEALWSDLNGRVFDVTMSPSFKSLLASDDNTDRLASVLMQNG